MTDNKKARIEQEQQTETNKKDTQNDEKNKISPVVELVVTLLVNKAAKSLKGIFTQNEAIAVQTYLSFKQNQTEKADAAYNTFVEALQHFSTLRLSISVTDAYRLYMHIDKFGRVGSERARLLRESTEYKQLVSLMADSVKSMSFHAARISDKCKDLLRHILLKQLQL